VKAYYALKLTGDRPSDAHMARARVWILEQGGAARSNVLTRITLALFGQVPWRAVPFIPVEIVILPRWFPFSLSRVSYWSRTVMVPLFVLTTLKPRAANPSSTGIEELFTTPPEEERDYFPVRSPLGRFFLLLDGVGRRIEPLIPGFVRRRAFRAADAWIRDRLGAGGLGAIAPAMVNAHEALGLLGHPEDSPYRKRSKQALRELVVVRGDEAYCQPCMSPVWDTALAVAALQEAGGAEDSVRDALRWLCERQLTEAPGDWRDEHPDLAGGGWAFQYENGHYPDLDDTAAVGYVLERSGGPEFREAVDRAAAWLVGMQSSNGGFASFDSDNTHEYLNEVPFADHGALLDPPTSDVSARCAMLFGILSRESESAALETCLEFLRREQEADGPWFGRWGTNYIYGTWSVLAALETACVPRTDPMVRRAVDWLASVQRPDGGWGESNDSYEHGGPCGTGGVNTAFQTAWAVLGLIAGGAWDAPEVRAGVEYLLRHQGADGLWDDDAFTAPGFPRVFYLRYHGYSKYFPLWALARYRNALSG
jgi:squalene-hopene/tetraprenyl-beta-curcumene cyclase